MEGCESIKEGCIVLLESSQSIRLEDIQKATFGYRLPLQSGHHAAEVEHTSGRAGLKEFGVVLRGEGQKSLEQRLS